MPAANLSRAGGYRGADTAAMIAVIAQSLADGFSDAEINRSGGFDERRAVTSAQRAVVAGKKAKAVYQAMMAAFCSAAGESLDDAGGLSLDGLMRIGREPLSEVELEYSEDRYGWPCVKSDPSENQVLMWGLDYWPAGFYAWFDQFGTDPVLALAAAERLVSAGWFSKGLNGEPITAGLWYGPIKKRDVHSMWAMVPWPDQPGGVLNVPVVFERTIRDYGRGVDQIWVCRDPLSHELKRVRVVYGVREGGRMRCVPDRAFVDELSAGIIQPE